MAQTTVTPLQLTAGVGLYNNTGLVANTDLANNITAYQSTNLIANIVFTMSEAVSNVTLSVTPSTIAALSTIGANVSANYLPVLGDSMPSNIAYVANTGVSSIITANTATIMGSGDLSIFIQAYGAAVGYIAVTNPLITSSVNATTSDFLGPTFTTMDNLITGDLTTITLALDDFGADIADLGELFTLDNFGTPAALLQQLSNVGGIVNGTVPAVRDALLAAGLTDQNIADLVNDNVQSLFNAQGLTPAQFDTLQKQAYPALCEVKGAALQSVLSIFEVVTPSINSMCELLNPVKIFPRSFASLTLPTANGPVLIYNLDGTVNQQIEPTLNSGSLSPVGCDELGKIIPRDQAAANRALQIAFGQIKNAASISLPQLAEVLT